MPEELARLLICRDPSEPGKKVFVPENAVLVSSAGTTARSPTVRKREARQLGLGLSVRGKVGAFSGRLLEAAVAAEDWSMDGDGNIIINPLVEYEMATPTGLGICVRLSVAVQTIESGTRVGNVQLAILPVQARELAYSLLDAADKIERTAPL
jgi:hypothetical protein